MHFTARGKHCLCGVLFGRVLYFIEPLKSCRASCFWSKRNLAFHWCWLVIMVYHLQCKFIADLGICISLTRGECLSEWALLCSNHGKHWPENWSIDMENQRNWLLQNPSGWNLNPLKGVGVVGWALRSWWCFCCWGAQPVLSAHTVVVPEAPSKILQDSPAL